MSRRQRYLGAALPLLGLGLSGCGGEMILTSVLSVAGPPLIEAALESASEDRPDQAKVDVLALAERMQAKGEYQNAALLYQRAHEREPAAAEPLVGLGDSLLALGAHAEATEAYTKALAIEPRNVEALRNLGNARIMQGQPQLAAAAYEAAARLKPRDPRVHNGLGVALDMSGDHAAAQAAYRAGLAVKPDDPSLLNNLGLSLALSGDGNQAVAMLERASRNPTARPVNRQNLALVYGLAGQFEAAERVAGIDLAAEGVERNLSYYAAHHGRESGDVLAQALGVELRGVQYAASPAPIPADLVAEAAAAETKMLGSAPVDPFAHESAEAALRPPVTIAAAPLAAPAAPAPTPPAIPAAPALEETPRAAPAIPVTAMPLPPAAAAGQAAAAAAEADPPVAPAAPAVAEPAPASFADAPAHPEVPRVHRSLPAAASAPETAAAPAPAGGVLVQLASYRTEEQARAGWRLIAARGAALLESMAPVIHRADLGTSRGIFYRLRTGPFATGESADSFCRALAARSIDCLVVEAGWSHSVPIAASPPAKPATAQVTIDLEGLAALHDERPQPAPVLPAGFETAVALADLAPPR